ncbi:LysR substrate-binding domain-containing protein [Sinorhizobium fredii]|uniref:LysR substrate-binding domain-containing protein n=2 Tax=Rhizobium fredii TaxID=380 RepID=UPI0004B74CC6|nr:hypothetical protein AB395_00004162 [Sinorhizobium fredii CCBAU 45436]
MKRRSLPLTALRAFEAAGRLGRMTAAAEELSVTHGAVSRQVQHLEQVLGVALFAGPRTKPQLTAAGRALLSDLSAALDQIEAAVQAVTRAKDVILDVSCLSTFLMRWLIPRLHRFHDRHPEIDVRLRALEDSADSRSEQADLVITVDALSRVSSYGRKQHVLFKEWLGLVATPDLISRRQVQSLGELPADLLLQTKTRLNAWSMWCDAACSAPLEPAGAVFEHYYYTLEAVSAGLGICVAPWHLVAGDIEIGRLVAPFGFVESGFCYVAKPRFPSAPKIDRFCQWLAEEAASMPRPPDPRDQPRDGEAPDSI